MSKEAQTRKPRQNKRDEIMQAAMRVFCHYGYDGATLEKVAQEAGVSKALVIKYFGTMHQLITLCLSDFAEAFVGNLEGFASGSENSFFAYSDYVFELFKTSRAEYRLLFSIFLTPAHGDIIAALLPKYLAATERLMELFPETQSVDAQPELNYIFYSLLVSYVMGGNEENYLRARDAVLSKYGLERP